MRRAIHLAALAVLAYTYYFIHTWMPRLPGRVPTHFGWQGKPDAWGSPNSVWIPFYMQIGVTCLLLLLPALCARYPQIGHIGTRRLSDLAAASREEATALIGEMTSRMLLAFNLLFFYITRETVKAAMMPGATSKPATNSGVFIRIEDRPKDEWFAVHHGYEVQIDDSSDEWHRTGAIYSISKATGKPSKPVGEWNVLEITLDGPRTVVSLNGVRVNDFREGQPVPERKQWYEPERRPRVEVGYIGVQNHDESSSVYFREISVLKLSH